MVVQKQKHSEKEFYANPSYYIHLGMLNAMNALNSSFNNAQNLETAIMLFDIHVSQLERLINAAEMIEENDEYEKNVEAKKNELLDGERAGDRVFVQSELANYRFGLLSRLFFRTKPMPFGGKW